MENLNKGDMEFTIDLIQHVQKNKCLYDKRDAFYFNKIKKEKVWSFIAKESNRPVQECRTKWKSLRERFSRELKKENCPSGSGSDYKCEWELMQDMNFVRDSMQPRRTLTNDTAPEVVIEEARFIDNDDAAPGHGSSSTKKRKTAFDGLCDKFGTLVEKLEDQFVAPSGGSEDDGDGDFLSSILSLMKTSPPEAKDTFKSEMLTRVIHLRRQNRTFGSI